MDWETLIHGGLVVVCLAVSLVLASLCERMSN